MWSSQLAAVGWEERLLSLAGAYAENTIRAYRSDFADFETWCSSAELESLPALPETVATYVEAMATMKTPATINRRIAGIGRVHRLLGHANPAASDLVAVALRRVTRAEGRRQKQAAGLSGKLCDRLVAVCRDDLLGLRDQAMISVGYDTLCRRSELVQLRAEDIEAVVDGSASILIRRSKTDQAGDGRLGYLSAETLNKVEQWLNASGISAGPMFRTVRCSSIGEHALHPYTVTRTLKRLAKTAGLEPALCERLSGHSMRVGAALDMAENGIDLVPIMHAGGWKSPGLTAPIGWPGYANSGARRSSAPPPRAITLKTALPRDGRRN